MQCPVCTSEKVSNTCEIDEFMFRMGERFTYAECGDCTSLYLVNPPHDYSNYYPASYYSVQQDPRVVFAGRLQQGIARLLAQSAARNSSALLRIIRVVSPIRQLRTFATSLLAIAKTGVRPTTILDVGTGNGFIPYAMSLTDVQKSWGVDPFCAMEIVDGSFSLLQKDLSKCGGTWKIIMFHHSLEHVSNPVQELQQAASLLENEGRIVVRIPMKDSDAWKTYSANWFQLDPPRHIFIPSRKGLEILAERAGLRVVSSYDDSTSAQFWLSEHVKKGRALTTTRSKGQDFQSPPRNPIKKLSSFVKSVRANRRSSGDQVCFILARQA